MAGAVSFANMPVYLSPVPIVNESAPASAKGAAASTVVRPPSSSRVPASAPDSPARQPKQQPPQRSRLYTVVTSLTPWRPKPLAKMARKTMPNRVRRQVMRNNNSAPAPAPAPIPAAARTVGSPVASPARGARVARHRRTETKTRGTPWVPRPQSVLLLSPQYEDMDGSLADRTPLSAARHKSWQLAAARQQLAPTPPRRPFALLQTPVQLAAVEPLYDDLKFTPQTDEALPVASPKASPYARISPLPVAVQPPASVRASLHPRPGAYQRLSRNLDENGVAPSAPPPPAAKGYVNHGVVAASAAATATARTPMQWTAAPVARGKETREQGCVTDAAPTTEQSTQTPLSALSLLTGDQAAEDATPISEDPSIAHGELECFHGLIDRAEATRRLSIAKQDGQFLIRSKDIWRGMFALSVFANGAVSHHLIQHLEGDRFYVNDTYMGDCQSLLEVVARLSDPLLEENALPPLLGLPLKWTEVALLQGQAAGEDDSSHLSLNGIDEATTAC